MSLVGPRPCLPCEYDRHLDWQKQRYNTLPGLTGLWQVSGKNTTTFNQMIRFDLEYDRNKSLWLDLTIMLRTIPAVITQIREIMRNRKNPEVIGTARVGNGQSSQTDQPTDRLH